MNKLYYTLRSRNNGEIKVFHIKEQWYHHVPYNKYGIAFYSDNGLICGCTKKKYIVDTNSDVFYRLRSYPESTEEAFEIKREALEII